MYESITIITTQIGLVLIDSLYQEMPVEEIVGSGDDSPHFFVVSNTYNRTKFFPSLHGFGGKY